MAPISSFYVLVKYLPSKEARVWLFDSNVGFEAIKFTLSIADYREL